MKQTFVGLLILSQVSCASSQIKTVAIGMLAGGATGAVVGHEFVHHGQYKQYQTRNTVITAIIFSLITGGILEWHYRALEQQQVEISGRYARFRLCNPDELPRDLVNQFTAESDIKGANYLIDPKQIGKFAISLDDNTKWTYPIFQKRFLPPERSDTQVISKRYIWEIIKPGSFVTRSQNPQFFSEEETSK